MTKRRNVKLGRPPGSKTKKNALPERMSVDERTQIVNPLKKEEKNEHNEDMKNLSQAFVEVFEEKYSSPIESDNSITYEEEVSEGMTRTVILPKKLQDIIHSQNEKIKGINKKIDKLAQKYREMSPTVDIIYNRLNSLSSQSWTPMGIQQKVAMLELEINKKDQQFHNLSKREMHLEEIVIMNPKIFKNATPKKLISLWINCSISSQQICKQMTSKTQIYFSEQELNALILGMNTNPETLNFLIEILEDYQLETEGKNDS